MAQVDMRIVVSSPPGNDLIDETISITMSNPAASKNTLRAAFIALAGRVLTNATENL